MIINDLDGYYIVFDTKNWNTELDTLVSWLKQFGSFTYMIDTGKNPKRISALWLFLRHLFLMRRKG